MKYLLIACMLLVASVSLGQTNTKAIRLYRLNDQIILNDPTGTNPSAYAYSQVSVGSFDNLIRVVINNASLYALPAEFLNATGSAYGTTVNAAITAYMATIPASGGGGGGGATTATISNPTVAATNTLVRVSDASTIASGALFVSILNVGSSAGTVLGATVDPGVSITFPAVLTKTQGAIPYNATGTTFLIQTTR